MNSPQSLTVTTGAAALSEFITAGSTRHATNTLVGVALIFGNRLIDLTDEAKAVMRKYLFETNYRPSDEESEQYKAALTACQQ